MAIDCPIANAAGWPVVNLKDITTKIGSGATPRGGSETYLDKRTSFALVRSQNVFDRRFDREGLAYITDEQAEGLKGVALQAGDVLLNITGDGVTFGRACMIPGDVRPACVNQHVSIIRVDPSLADPGYVLSFLTHPGVKPYIEAFNAGGSRRAITKGHIESFRLPLPKLVEQRAIAHILGTLDDKIELNRRRNQTLEAMARALFKDWFVDFGPIRAKMEGHEPYLPADIWQLFLDRLDEEGKPEGWEMRHIGDIGQVVCGKTPSTRVTEYYGDDVPFITIPEMHGRIFATDIKKRLSLSGASSQAKKTLPPGAICVSCIATLGLVTITTEPSQTNQQINSVIPDEAGTTYFWYWSLRNLGEEIKAGGSGGSVLSNLSTGRFSQLQVNASSEPLRLAYNSCVKTMFDQILTNERESQTLAQLRDTLLPKLISGELRIADAEKFIERNELQASNPTRSVS